MARILNLRSARAVFDLLETRKDPSIHRLVVSARDAILKRKALLLLPEEVEELDYSGVVTKMRFKDTGLVFELGKVCSPSSKDVTRALEILLENDALDPDLLPHYLTMDQLFGERSYYYRKYYLKSILEVLGIRYESRRGGWQFPWKPDNIVKSDYVIFGACWVLMCWDYVQQPKKRVVPSLPGVASSRLHKRTSVMRLQCPFCGRQWKPEDNRIKDSAKMRLFRYWLREHSYEYHRWNLQSRKKMVQPKKFTRMVKGA